MGVTINRSTLIGAVTPICNTCGITLCWDISEEEYEQSKRFWDAWICQECNNDIPFNRSFYEKLKIRNEIL